MTVPTLEDLFAGSAFADIDASPLQRAICRAADGRPLEGVLTDDELRAYFGTTDIPTVRPTVVPIVAGVRGGKSFLTACALIRCALAGDLSHLKFNEIPRATIIAPNVDNAAATLRILIGVVEGSPVLRAMLEGAPTSDGMLLRRPDGRRVEVVVVAAHRGGMALRSRWLVFAALEEVAGFGSESMGAAISAEDQFAAAETRLVPGGQVWLPSSPFGKAGLLYSLYAAHFGKPGRVLVVHAPTRAMNPSFPLEQIEAVRLRNPDTAAREHDAIFLDTDTQLNDSTLIDRAVRATPLEHPPAHGKQYVAAWDPATRGNAWTLIIGHAVNVDGVRGFVVDLAREWVGSRQAPLSPMVVINQASRILDRYGVPEVHTDTWSTDAHRDIAQQVGLRLVEHAGSKDGMHFAVTSMLASDLLELPPHAQLIADLKSLRKKALANGIRVDLPRTPDGRHADYAPSLALALHVSQTYRPPARGDGAAVQFG